MTNSSFSAKWTTSIMKQVEKVSAFKNAELKTVSLPEPFGISFVCPRHIGCSSPSSMDEITRLLSNVTSFIREIPFPRTYCLSASSSHLLVCAHSCSTVMPFLRMFVDYDVKSYLAAELRPLAIVIGSRFGEVPALLVRNGFRTIVIEQDFAPLVRLTATKNGFENLISVRQYAPLDPM